ncbi:hypothetical protein [Nocardia fluminea]|uniref:hypothetical protein n=1 Tax=Nocardia fluminea TaxID=134984 RepID=UPI003D12F668
MTAQKKLHQHPQKETRMCVLTDPDHYSDSCTPEEQVMRADFARAYLLRRELFSASVERQPQLREQISALDVRWTRPDGQVFLEWQHLIDLVTGAVIEAAVLPIQARSYRQAAELVELGPIEGPWR